MFDEADALQLADALAASRTLTRLELCAVGFWENAAAAGIMMRAFTGHPCLEVLDLSGNAPPRDQLAAGAALGALLASNTPALEVLRLSNAALGDAGLGGLCDALPRNTHLSELDLHRAGVSEAFARNVFLPAVRANTSLRVLIARQDWGDVPARRVPPELAAAEALVAARNNNGD